MEKDKTKEVKVSLRMSKGAKVQLGITYKDEKVS